MNYSCSDSYRELYEEIAQKFPQNRLLEGYHHFRRLQMVLKLMDRLGEDLLVLDAGCGDGIQAAAISNKNRVIGIDISQTRLRRAQEIVNKGSFINGDLLSLPFKDNIFDVVLFLEVLEHLPGPIPVLRELRRIVKRGGYLILDTPSKTNIVDILLRLIGRNPPNWGLYLDKSHLFFYNMSEVKGLLKRSGFDCLKVRGAPCLRINLPILEEYTWDRRRWGIYKFTDAVLGAIPFLRQLGAFQVFMARKI